MGAMCLNEADPAASAFRPIGPAATKSSQLSVLNPKILQYPTANETRYL